MAHAPTGMRTPSTPQTAPSSPDAVSAPASRRPATPERLRPLQGHADGTGCRCPLCGGGYPPELPACHCGSAW